MNFKTLGAMLCVFIMIACPIATLAVDSDATDEDLKVSSTVKVENLNKVNIEDVFLSARNIESNIGSGIISTIGINDQIPSYSTLTSTISNFDYVGGKSITETSDKKSVIWTEYHSYECEFDFTYKINENVRELKLLVPNTEFEGGAVTKLLERFKNMKLESGDTVRFLGEIYVSHLTEYIEDDRFTNSEKNYYPLKITRTQFEKVDFDVNVYVNGAQIHDKYNQRVKINSETEYNIINGFESDYKPGLLQAMRGNSYFKILKSNGTRTIDGDDFNYKLSDTISNYYNGKYDWTVSQGPSESPEIPDKIQFKELRFFENYISDEDIIKNVEKVNGIATTDFDEFKKNADSVKSEFNESSNNDNILVLLAIAAIIVVVLILAYLYYNRKKQQPEE